jgi:hypothetical protein
MSATPSLRLGRLADLPALILFSGLLFGLLGACGDSGAVAALAKQHAAAGSSAAAVDGLPPRLLEHAAEAIDFNRRSEDKGADGDQDVHRHAAPSHRVFRQPALLPVCQVRHAARARNHHPRDPPALI